jgi:hypothetical protein
MCLFHIIYQTKSTKLNKIILLFVCRYFLRSYFVLTYIIGLLNVSSLKTFGKEAKGGLLKELIGALFDITFSALKFLRKNPWEVTWERSLDTPPF